MAVCCICDVKFGLQTECVSFHRFPKDEDKRVHWFTAIGEKVKNFIFIPNSQICSKHFTMECFVITCSGKRYLKADAVPSIFNIPLKQGLELIRPVQQQLYTPKCDNAASMNHKQEEIRISKIIIKPINNKYFVTNTDYSKKLLVYSKCIFECLSSQ
nr:PREDICTED: THAP domain-containing protein 1-like [Linepithema humile]